MHLAAPRPRLSDRGLTAATPALESLVVRALAIRADDRFDSAAAMMAAVDAAALSL
jgi:hypothetical protein